MTDETAAATDLPALPESQGRAAKEIMAMTVGGDVQAIIPRTIDEAFRFAQLVVMAGLCPNSYETNGKPDPQKICIGILAGAEVGVPPMQALRGICIINGRPSIWGDLAVALVQSKGVLLKMEHVFTGTEPEDDWTCRVVMYRRGQELPYEGKFSVKDAKRARLWGNAKKPIWAEYPSRMLLARARAYALRDGFADCLSGLAIAEEAQDLPEAPKPVDALFLTEGAPEVPATEHTTEGTP